MTTDEQVLRELRNREAQATIKKLVLYAEHKRKLRDMIDPAYHSREAKRLKQALLNDGISPELLDLQGDEIAQVIYESLSKRGYA